MSYGTSTQARSFRLEICIYSVHSNTIYPAACIIVEVTMRYKYTSICDTCKVRNQQNQPKIYFTCMILVIKSIITSITGLHKQVYCIESRDHLADTLGLCLQ